MIRPLLASCYDVLAVQRYQFRLGGGMIEGLLFGLGLVGGALISWYFARQSGKELREETERLRNLITMLVIGMERQGWIDAEYDKWGRVIGWKPITGVSNVTLGSLTASATGEVRDQAPVHTNDVPS